MSYYTCFYICANSYSSARQEKPKRQPSEVIIWQGHLQRKTPSISVLFLQSMLLSVHIKREGESPVVSPLSSEDAHHSDRYQVTHNDTHTNHKLSKNRFVRLCFSKLLDITTGLTKLKSVLWTSLFFCTAVWVQNSWTILEFVLWPMTKLINCYDKQFLPLIDAIFPKVAIPSLQSVLN